jgi:small subunit ribosomal protein S20
MANLQSSKKDIRRIARRTERNRDQSSRLKTLRKKAVGDASPEAKAEYASALDKAVKNGIVHKNKVAREKSKLSRGALHSKSHH